MPRTLRLQRPSGADDADATTWIDLDLHDDDTIAWIEQQSGLPDYVAQRLLDRDELNRRETVNSGLLICFHVPRVSARAGEDDTVSLRIWIEPHRVITVRGETLAACDALHASASEDPQGSWEPFRILAFLISSSVRQLEELIGRVVSEIGQLEDQILASEDEFDAVQLDNVRRSIIRVRRYLVVVRNVLVFTASDQSLTYSTAESDALESATSHVRVYLESLEDCHERARLLQDQVESRMASRLNRITYNLTIVATVFLPLSFLTGLLGMNVAGIPDAHNPSGFLIVCIVMIIVAIGFWWFLHWRRWV